MRPVSYRPDCQDRYNAIKSSVGDVRRKKILDIGCGNGYFLARFLEDGASKVIGVETDSQSHSEAIQAGVVIKNSINEVNEKFDICLFLDLQFHDNIDYVDFCKKSAKVVFISPSGDGKKNNARLKDILVTKFDSVVEVIKTDYAHRMIYKCQ